MLEMIRLAFSIILSICFLLADLIVPVLIGACFAIRNCFLAVTNNINFLEWSWERGTEPARRSYFFGPGYVQLLNTIKQVFVYNDESVEWFENTAEDIEDNVSAESYWDVVGIVLSYVFHYLGLATVTVLGTALTLAVTGALALVMAVVMVCIYVAYSIVWLVDIVYLTYRHVRPICQTCKDHKFIIPAFICPGCGAIHRHLVPGPYGILHHTCRCGMRLPSTFLNGRSSLEAHCPKCNAKLVASDTTPIIIQMAGGIGAGKTVYVAAFYHWLAEALKSSSGMDWEIPKDFVPYFDDLEKLYNGAGSHASSCKNAQLYPMIISLENNRKYMFSIFDIAGEIFSGRSLDQVTQQKQFAYCNGFLMILDPFCKGSNLAVSDPEKRGIFSEMGFDEVVISFINYMHEIMQTRIDTKIPIPLSVVIAKCDIEAISQELSEDAITDLMNSESEEMTRDEARDRICRAFIDRIGFYNELDILERNFSNIHYFPVSAMGHEQNGTVYNPIGVTEPVRWIVERENLAPLSLLFTSGGNNSGHRIIETSIPQQIVKQE